MQSSTTIITAIHEKEKSRFLSLSDVTSAKRTHTLANVCDGFPLPVVMKAA